MWEKRTPGPRPTAQRHRVEGQVAGGMGLEAGLLPGLEEQARECEDTLWVRDQGLDLHRDPGLVEGTGPLDVCERGRGGALWVWKLHDWERERLESAVWGGGWG